MSTKLSTEPPSANVVFLRDFYAAFLKGDADTAAKFLTPDFIMHIPGRGMNAGEYWGRTGLKKFMGNISAYNGGIKSMVGPSLPKVAGPTSSDTKALINTFYNRFWNGDMAGMKQLVADDIVFYVPGRSHLAGEYRTWNGYLAFRNKLMLLAGDKYKLEIASIAAGETDAFVKEYVRMNR